MKNLSFKHVRKPLLALLSGALVPLSMSPMDIWPVGILAVFGLCLALNSVSARTAAITGFGFGLGMFGLGASWVYVSIATYGNVSAILAVLITLIFILVLSLFPALQCWLYQRFFSHKAFTPLSFAALWLFTEWLRSWLFTGFPWLFLGYAHIHSPLSGLAPVIGVMGIGFIVALTASVLYQLMSRILQASKAAALCLKPALGINIALIVLCWSLPSALLSRINWVEDTGTITAGLVHGTIPQDEKFDIDLRLEHLVYFEDMTESLWGHDIILWPETAIAFYYQRAAILLEQLDQQARDNGSSLVSGIFYNDSGKVYNSILGLGLGSGIYHKQKLVPFGEYVPFQGLIGPLLQIFDLPMSTIRPGPHQQGLLNAGDIKLAPYICYEVVYPDFVRQSAGKADILLTISNDTWFGTSWGPRQHLQMAAMRALENQRYMLRATNNGLSAVIDKDGNILAQSTQFDPQVISSTVHTYTGQTPYSRFGTWPMLALSILMLLAARRSSGKYQP